MSVEWQFSDADVAKFWALVDASGDCWEWTGPRSQGYGGSTSRTIETWERIAPYGKSLSGPFPMGYISTISA